MTHNYAISTYVVSGQKYIISVVVLITYPIILTKSPGVSGIVCVNCPEDASDKYNLAPVVDMLLKLVILARANPLNSTPAAPVVPIAIPNNEVAVAEPILLATALAQFPDEFK
jgi:hypothetical protein